MQPAYRLLKNRYRLMTRGARGGAFYCVDFLTGKRASLGTVDRDAAEQIVLARNQALRAVWPQIPFCARAGPESVENPARSGRALRRT